MTNPDNSPEEFAALLVADHLIEQPKVGLSHTQVATVERAVAFEIRRQLDLACLNQAKSLKKRVETMQQDSQPM